MKKITIHTCLLVLLVLITGCASDDMQNTIPDGSTPVQLSGIVTRAGTPRTNMYVKAFLSGAPYIYFNETQVNMPQGVSTNDTTAITFPAAKPYYPLDEDEEISIFAYSNKASGDYMILTAGQGINNDAILSNYGKRRSDNAVRPDYAPSGTPGSAADPAEVLQFRHVMTQVNVSVVYSEQLDQPVSNLQLQMPGMVNTGRYAIRAAESDVAISSSGLYTLRLGTNYLIPNGVNLTGVHPSLLIIDNYTASQDDRNSFSIQPETSTQPDQQMLLMPGYSYNLVFTISRLKVQSITVQKVDWIPQEVTANVDYNPYSLDLQLGSYVNSGNDSINRVVLKTADRTYVGKKAAGTNAAIEFVTLPQSGVTSVSLFTKRGLLLDTDITTGYTYSETGSSLTLELSQGGMIPVNPALPYNAATNPYALTTPQQFMNIANDLTASYSQQSTIDLRTLNLIDTERIFNGFGTFTGTYNGNGNRIDGIDIVAPGLFAVNNGTLQGIRITTGTINATGQAITGALAGTNNGTIAGCINEARIIQSIAGTVTLGGISGTNTGSIIACLNTGTILDGTTVGGICGNNQNTAAGAITACINTGNLNPNAIDLGYICGISAESGNDVLQTNYALVGTAQRIIGGPEFAVGTGTVGMPNTASLEPFLLRNGLEAGETEDMRVVNRLNAALAATSWGNTYEYVYDNSVTAVTWPAPIVITNP